MRQISVHNNWDPLEEIWLGDVWPIHFYDDLKPEVRDSFYQLTEWSKDDLKVIKQKFEEFGVTVVQPKIENDKSIYINSKGRLIKPPICPRDYSGVIGNKLFYGSMGFDEKSDSFNHIKNLYSKECIVETHDKKYIRDTFKSHISGADVVKLGRDIIFDNGPPLEWQYRVPSKQKFREMKKRYFSLFIYFNEEVVSLIGNDYRIHLSFTGGHVDSQFMPVRPGLLLATKYWNHYDQIMPGWEKIFLSEPTWISEHKKYKLNDMNMRWHVENSTGEFNDYVEKYCKSWIGNIGETHFEVNIVMIDEKTMFCVDTAQSHMPLFDKLDKAGINIHVLPWRSRTFWDGGLHCITLDVRRTGTLQDYFPQREGYGLKSFLDQHYNNDLNMFLLEYNTYKETGLIK